MMTIPRDTERLARLVAARQGTTPEDVVRSAVQEHATALGLAPADEADLGHSVQGARDVKAELIAGMEAIAARSAARQSADRRSIDEIIGYDDFGLPR